MLLHYYNKCCIEAISRGIIIIILLKVSAVMEVLSNVIAVIPHTELTRRAGEAKWDRIVQ